jgi:RNA-directed DNA polymerase
MPFSRIRFIEDATKQGHSNDFISECISYAENLHAKQLPVIFSTIQLCLLTSTAFAFVQDVIENPSTHYKTYSINKRNGGKRPICAPTSSLKYLQKWILSNILERVALHQSCTSFQKNKSIIDNAHPHVGASTILKIDLKDFFTSIRGERVFQIFRNLGYATNLAYDLAFICTYSDLRRNSFEIENLTLRYLAQGAPTSPALSNIAGAGLDEQFSRLAAERGIIYTRYADDLTFSGDSECIPSVRLIRSIIENLGFDLNPKKVTYAKRGMRQTVTGLEVGNGITVPRPYKKSIWRHLHFCKKFGEQAHLQKIGMSEKTNFHDWLLGKIMFVNMVEPLTGSSMLKAFNEIPWTLGKQL